MVSGEVGYILSFKNLHSEQGNSLYVLKDKKYVTRINADQQGQFIIGIKEEKSKDITLHLTSTFKQH